MGSRFVSTDMPRRQALRPRRFGAATVVAGFALAIALVGCRPRAGTVAPVALRITVVDADADADVYVDGHYMGQVRALSGDPLGTVQLTPGTHRVEVRKAGRFPVQRTVRVDADSPAELRLDAELLEDPQ